MGKYPSPSLLWKELSQPRRWREPGSTYLWISCSSPLPSYSHSAPRFCFGESTSPPLELHQLGCQSQAQSSPGQGVCVWPNSASSLLELNLETENGWHWFLLAGMIWGYPGDAQIPSFFEPCSLELSLALRATSQQMGAFVGVSSGSWTLAGGISKTWEAHVLARPSLLAWGWSLPGLWSRLQKGLYTWDPGVTQRLRVLALSPTAWVQTLGQPLTSCMTLGELLTFSMFLHPHLQTL